MKNIAFKRAKHSPQMKESLHPEFITEYADISLFPEGFHRPEDGFEILSEDLFEVELAKNESYHAEFLEKKAKLEQDLIKAREAQELQELAQEKKDLREYEEFKKWKKMKGKR